MQCYYDREVFQGLVSQTCTGHWWLWWPSEWAGMYRAAGELERGVTMSGHAELLFHREDLYFLVLSSPDVSGVSVNRYSTYHKCI